MPSGSAGSRLGCAHFSCLTYPCEKIVSARTWNVIFFPGWPTLAGFALFCDCIAGVFPWLSAPTKSAQWQNLLTGSRPPQEVFEELYRELKIIARSRMAGEKPNQTLCATILVHEAWLRLDNGAGGPWQNRAHFFGAASEAMRRILVEAARRRHAVKRGSGQQAVPMDGIDLPDETDHQQILEVNDVLDKLEAEDPIKAQIVKMRFFCGMENEEIAAILDVNEKTVRRHWQLAKVILFRAIQGGN